MIQPSAIIYGALFATAFFLFCAALAGFMGGSKRDRATSISSNRFRLGARFIITITTFWNCGYNNRGTRWANLES